LHLYRSRKRKTEEKVTHNKNNLKKKIKREIEEDAGHGKVSLTCP
jgi:hypothetical protein